MTVVTGRETEARSGSFSAALRSLWLALRPHSPKHAGAAELRQVIAGLEGMNQSTETSFLEVGKRLMGFLSTSRQIHAEMCQLAELVSGEHADLACRSLEGVLNHTRQAAARTGRTSETLSVLQQATTRVHQSFATFHDTQMSLQVAVTLARIETSRFGSEQADLANLASEIGACSEGIQQRVDNLIGASDALYRRVGAVLARIAELDARGLSALPVLMNEITGDLNAFRERRRETATLSMSLRTQVDELIKAIGNVATSIQFHDITRQQVEHVIEALNGLLPAAGGAKLQGAGAAVSSVVRLQSAQLGGAAEAFTGSVNSIRRDLDIVASRSQQMASQSGALLGTSGQGQDSFLSQMERRFAGILDTVSECQSLDQGMRSTLAELNQLLSRLRTAVEEIRVVEIQLRRLSINIAVRAGHLGASGEPLNVIAAAVQELQMDCGSRSGLAEEAMDAITREIASITEASAGDWVASADRAEGDLRGRMSDLRASSESGAEIAARTTSLAAELVEQIRELRAGITVDRLFDSTVENCRDRLDDLIDQHHTAGGVHHSNHLVDAQVRYTMETERAIHERVAGTVAAPVAAAAAAAVVAADDGFEMFDMSEEPPAVPAAEAVVASDPPPSTDGDLGDNVELF